MPGTVGALKALLANVPDETPLVVYSEAMDSEVCSSATYYTDPDDYEQFDDKPVFVLSHEC